MYGAALLLVCLCIRLLSISSTSEDDGVISVFKKKRNRSVSIFSPVIIVRALAYDELHTVLPLLDLTLKLHHMCRYCW